MVCIDCGNSAFIVPAACFAKNVPRDQPSFSNPPTYQGSQKLQNKKRRMIITRSTKQSLVT